MSKRLVRSPLARVATSSSRVVFVSETGEAFALEGAAAAFAATVLRELESPRARDELEALVVEATGSSASLLILAELLTKLLDAGILEERDEAPPASLRSSPRVSRRVVVAVSGAIAAVEAPRLVGLLQDRGFEVRVATTASARRFVSTQALAALTHAPVAKTSLRGSGGAWVPHVELAEWAEAVVVYPASATTLSRLARGDFSDIVSAIALTTRAPVLIAPSMNHAMLASAAVQRNLATLEDDGLFVALPSRGREVADPPGRRAPRGGVALGPERLVDLVAALIQAAAPARAVHASDWDRLYASDEALAWEDGAAYDALVREIARVAKPGARVLDVGGGTGELAARLAAAGFRVVMTEVSSAAIERARARLGARADVLVVRDDATDTVLGSEFDVVVDRATLHALPREALGGYASSARRWLAPGGLLFVVHDKPGADARRPTLRLDAVGLAAALALDVVSPEADWPLEGEPGTRAFLSVLSRPMLGLP